MKSLSEQTHDIDAIMDDENKSKASGTEVKALATTPAPVSAATAALKDLLALRLNLSAKELGCHGLAISFAQKHNDLGIQFLVRKSYI